MGNVSPIDSNLKSPKQKRRTRSSVNKYLKPGALVQMRYTKAMEAKSCTDLGKKRVALLGDETHRNEIENKISFIEKGNGMLSPEKVGCSPLTETVDLIKQNNLMRTPMTPRYVEFESESRLESLPMDLLVNVICHLHHDHLKTVFHVSQKIRKAVLVARQFYFNYTTPDRSRQEMLSATTPLPPTERWLFSSKLNKKSKRMSSLRTPKAPRHAPRPPPRFKSSDMRQITAVLFRESAFPRRCRGASVLKKSIRKSLASNRVLLYEDELCLAVAQNKLL